MTIGPDFVYVCIPRTASNMMERHFLPRYGGRPLSDTDVYAYHANQVPDKYKDRFTFTIIRNPYTRMLSYYRFMMTWPSGHPEAKTLDRSSAAAFVHSLLRPENRSDREPSGLPSVIAICRV